MLSINASLAARSDSIPFACDCIVAQQEALEALPCLGLFAVREAQEGAVVALKDGIAAAEGRGAGAAHEALNVEGAAHAGGGVNLAVVGAVTHLAAAAAVHRHGRVRLTVELARDGGRREVGLLREIQAAGGARETAAVLVPRPSSHAKDRPGDDRLQAPRADLREGLDLLSVVLAQEDKPAIHLHLAEGKLPVRQRPLAHEARRASSVTHVLAVQKQTRVHGELALDALGLEQLTAQRNENNKKN